MKKTLIAFLFLAFTVHAAPQSAVEDQGTYLKNQITNPGFENGKTKWSINNPTGTLSSGASTLINTRTVGVGTRSLTWRPVSNLDSLQQQASFPSGFIYSAGLAKCRINTQDNGYYLRVLNGSSVAASTFVPPTDSANSTFNHVGVGFTFLHGTSTATLQIQNTKTSATPLTVDDCYLGPEIQAGASTVQTDFSDWFVAAEIVNTVNAGGVSLGTGDVAAFDDVDATDLSLTPLAQSQAVGISCSAAASIVGNTTCAANETLGVTFNVPSAGVYEACAQFSHDIDLTSAGGTDQELNAEFKLASVNVTTGVSPEYGGGAQVTAHRISGITENTYTVHPVKTCAIFYFASAGQKAVQLWYRQDVDTAAVTGSKIRTTNGSAPQNIGKFSIFVRPF